MRRSKNSASLDHIVGAGNECRWNFDSKGLGGLWVDHELEFCRLLDWQIRWLIALK